MSALSRLLRDERIRELLAREDVAAFGLRALRAKGELHERVREVRERVAHRLGVPTFRDLRELKRHIRRLEGQLAEAQRELRSLREVDGD